MTKMFCTQLVHFTDDEVYIIGGAGFESEQERLENWNSIPELERELRPQAKYRVEMIDEDSQILAEKDITEKTAIALIGSKRKLQQAIEKAKKELVIFIRRVE